MTRPIHQKVTASHLRRDAYLYVRQSTVRQVFENTESTQRQYALRERAVALGWSIEHVHVIDSDLGKSGASSSDREGFQALVGEVGMGRAGIVLGLEVSRLARNSTDWHRLLEICALTDTLILDEDGIYNPGDFNDRLLLGLKGTMSDAELHVLRARLRGGILNQARRGALKTQLPIGFAYDEADNVVLDLDSQVRASIEHLFETFERTGSASATVKYFRRQKLRFPRRLCQGPHKGELLWGELNLCRVLRVLHNPRYAGAFFYGRTRGHKRPGKSIEIEVLPRDEWIALFPDAHPGYITWEQFESNLTRLRNNAPSNGLERRKSPPREGPALLQGIVICGVCGRRMKVHYNTRRGRQWPDYICNNEDIETEKAYCQYISGSGVDEAIGELLVETLTPVTLEVAMQVQAELDARADEANALRRQRVEHARYEVDLARRRFMATDPDNRLVVDVLEAEWNGKLRALHDAQEELEQRRTQDHLNLDDERREQIIALATDFPRLWNDPKTSQRERKRMVRLLLEDVTLIKGDTIAAGLRFRGGAVQSLSIPLAQPAWRLRQTSPQVVAEIDALLDEHTEGQIARILNERGYLSGEGNLFHAVMVQNIRRNYGLKTRYDRLRMAGMLTREEAAAQLNISIHTLGVWRRAGLLHAHPVNDNNKCLYEPLGNNASMRYKHKGLTARQRRAQITTHSTKEVQCEA